MLISRIRHLFQSFVTLGRAHSLPRQSLSTRGFIHTSCVCLKQTRTRQKGKSVQAQKWVARQARDVYVKKAHKESYRCRSAFKLLEIDEQHNILRPGDVVIDCGAAPGSWCEVAVQKVNANAFQPGEKVGRVIGIDIQHMAAVEGATILYQTDFTLPDSQAKLMEILDGQKVDVVISDMAPNATGHRALDHEIIIQLSISALRFSTKVLREQGHFLCKIWQGNEQPMLENIMKACFGSTQVVKPHSSRKDSAEVFLLCKNYRGIPR